jgi:hypothetical protein
MMTVVRQNWEESERGCGIRPDGYSLHLSEIDREQFIKDFWADQPGGPVPDEYSRPSGSGFLVDVQDHIYKEIQTSKNGIRKYG